MHSQGIGAQLSPSFWMYPCARSCSFPRSSCQLSASSRSEEPLALAIVLDNSCYILGSRESLPTIASTRKTCRCVRHSPSTSSAESFSRLFGSTAACMSFPTCDPPVALRQHIDPPTGVSLALTDLNEGLGKTLPGGPQAIVTR